MAQNELSKKRNLGYQIKELSKKGLSYRQIEKKLNCIKQQLLNGKTIKFEDFFQTTDNEPIECQICCDTIDDTNNLFECDCKVQMHKVCLLKANQLKDEPKCPYCTHTVDKSKINTYIPQDDLSSDDEGLFVLPASDSDMDIEDDVDV